LIARNRFKKQWFGSLRCHSVSVDPFATGARRLCVVAEGGNAEKLWATELNGSTKTERNGKTIRGVGSLKSLLGNRPNNQWFGSSPLPFRLG
jgi:hypothetical protein